MPSCQCHHAVLEVLEEHQWFLSCLTAVYRGAIPASTQAESGGPHHTLAAAGKRSLPVTPTVQEAALLQRMSLLPAAGDSPPDKKLSL